MTLLLFLLPVGPAALAAEQGSWTDNCFGHVTDDPCGQVFSVPLEFCNVRRFPSPNMAVHKMTKLKPGAQQDMSYDKDQSKPLPPDPWPPRFDIWDVQGAVISEQ